MRYRHLFPLLIILAFIIALSVRAPAQQPAGNAALTVEEVVNMHRAGFSDDVIITKIKKYGKPFDLSTDEMVDLKKAGLNDNIIKFLLDPSQPNLPSAAAPAAPPKSQEPEKTYPPDSLASKVPSEAGLYFFSGDAPTKIDIKLLLGNKEGGMMMVKKGRVVAYLVGPAAKTRITKPKPVLYLHLPEGKEMAEFVLTALLKKDGRRELDISPGPKPEIKPEAMRQFDPTQVGAKLYRLVPENLAAGEYLLFLVGSADPAKGTYGKGFDFAIDEPPAAPKK